MEYIAPRDMTVASRSGRSAEFKKNTPTYCPPQMHAELIACGIVPAEEIEEVVTEGTVEPTVPTDRQAALFAAFEKIILRNERTEFTSAGSPHCAVLAKVLDWPNIDAKERDAAWAKFQSAKAA